MLSLCVLLLLLLCIPATIKCGSLMSDAIDTFLEANAGKRCNFFLVCSVNCPRCCATDVFEYAYYEASTFEFFLYTYDVRHTVFLT